jgi:hypothetical protein
MSPCTLTAMRYSITSTGWMLGADADGEGQ